MSSEISKGHQSAAVAVFAEYMSNFKGERGWLDYHLVQQTNFARGLVFALATCELRVDGLGKQLARELAEIRYTPAAENKEGWMAGFEQLVQKLAEVVVARTICTFPWPDSAQIECEPLNSRTGGRPDFVVTTSEHVWLFEVKCPSFIKHQEVRQSRGNQLPIRSPLIDSFKDTRENVTLPRDNTLKDFLHSAEKKFRDFSEKPTTGILVVAWDMNMYEAIAVLSHPEAGLLTANSWHKEGGERVPFDAVSGVIVLNRLYYLAAGAQEAFDPKEFDPFELGGNGSPPNTWCPNLGIGDLEENLAQHFDAWHFDGTAVAADYALLDYVMWFNASRPAPAFRPISRRVSVSLKRLLSSSSLIALGSGHSHFQSP